jgi:hypothetical protein
MTMTALGSLRIAQVATFLETLWIHILNIAGTVSLSQGLEIKASRASQILGSGHSNVPLYVQTFTMFTLQCDPRFRAPKMFMKNCRPAVR